MIQAMYLEFYKCKRQKILPFLLLVLAAEIALGLRGLLKPGNNTYDPILYGIYQLSGFNILLYPLLSAVLSSRICDVEHKGSAFKLLLPHMKYGHLFLAKFLCCFCYLLLYTSLQLFFLTALAAWSPLESDYGPSLILTYGLLTLLASLPILIFELLLSLLIVNQTYAVLAGLAGGILGFISILFPPIITRMLPWSYFYLTAPVWSEYLQKEQRQILHLQAIPAALIIVELLLFTALFGFGWYRFTRKEAA